MVVRLLPGRPVRQTPARMCGSVVILPIIPRWYGVAMIHREPCREHMGQHFPVPSGRIIWIRSIRICLRRILKSRIRYVWQNMTVKEILSKELRWRGTGNAVMEWTISQRIFWRIPRSMWIIRQISQGRIRRGVSWKNLKRWPLPASPIIILLQRHTTR